MMKLFTTLAALILFTVPLAVQPTRGGDGQDKDKDKEKPASIWMKEKLTASQNILAGLAKEDFDAIDKNAQTMLFLDHLEKWLRGHTGLQRPVERFRVREQIFAAGGT